MKRNENGKTEGNILSICCTTYRSSNDRKATVQRCFERSPGGREKRKLRRCQRTKDSKCTHILLVRTSNPSSLFYLFPPSPHTHSLFISLYLYLFSVFDLLRVLSSSFSFLGLRQKELSLLRCFSPIYVEYIHRASPLNAVVPLTYSYIYATTHVSNSLSTYPSIYIYIYTYYYNDTYIYRCIPLCIALSHARQITEPQVKLANSCAVLELTR